MSATAATFNIREFGATGQKAQDARPAVQRAIDACAAAGGGVVVFPPGQYTSGTLHLCSNLRIELEPNATLFAAADPNAYDYAGVPTKAALFFGENIENVSLTGKGVIDGQAEYEWKPDDLEHTFDHKVRMEKLGKPTVRPVPKGYPKREVFPHLIWLGRSTNVTVQGLNLLHSPGWTISLFACERIRFDALYIYSSLREAVWSDGIDLDGCHDISISNCMIETGDDCVALVSQNWWGQPQPCHDVTITNCHFSTASAGIKFSEGNIAGIHDIRVVNTIFNNVNRGLAFNDMLGGMISNVLVLNATINCARFDWFWAGDGQPVRTRVGRFSEWNREKPKPGEAAAGAIRNLTLRNVVARAKGSSLFWGAKENWLDGITLENVRLYISSDSLAAYDSAEHALDFRYARNIKLKDVEVSWQYPVLKTWKSALHFEDVSHLSMDDVLAAPAPRATAPVIGLKNVSGALIRNCRPSQQAKNFVRLLGSANRDIHIEE